MAEQRQERRERVDTNSKVVSEGGLEEVKGVKSRERQKGDDETLAEPHPLQGETEGGRMQAETTRSMRKGK